jgi:DNA (cytosine-5)-methyltransferase 1
MARAAQVFQPTHVIIENVSGAAHDRSGVVQAAIGHLRSLGYAVVCQVIDGLKIGIPQRRKRLVVVASRAGQVAIEGILAMYSCEMRDLAWAIGDLEDEGHTSIYTTPSSPNENTMRRINYLFDNALFDLPDEQRPPCHRNKRHTYQSVYGRLRWSQPAQTITRGFYCMCMGRYVHPSRPRTLTAHEAARIQFFPDFFDFGPAGNRTALARIIGNAVPMKFSYVLGRELLKLEGSA